MSYCTPCPPCDTELPIFCESLDPTNTATAFVVEDSSGCQKRLSGIEGQIPQITNGIIKFAQSTSANTPNSIVSRNTTGGAAFSSISGTELILNNPSGDTRIEVGGAGNVYMDLKNPNSDDYDLRLQATGTTPRIFTNAATLQIDGTNVNFQTNTNGNVGIGTNAPTVKLEVSQTQTAQTAIRVVNTDTSSLASSSYIATGGGVTVDITARLNAQADIGTSSTHPLIIKSNDIERLRVTSGGNIGVGTSAPLGKFHVSGATSDDIVLITQSGAGVPFRVEDQTTDTTPFIIDTNGNVGIGTSTPTAKLEVFGGIASTNPTLGIGYGTGAGGSITQITSRVTPVTIDKICGSIILFTDVGIPSYTSFVVNNTTIEISDTIIVTTLGGSNDYFAHANKIVAGTSFIINFVSVSGVASDTPTFNFTIIKSVIT